MGCHLTPVENTAHAGELEQEGETISVMERKSGSEDFTSCGLLWFCLLMLGQSLKAALNLIK